MLKICSYCQYPYMLIYDLQSETQDIIYDNNEQNVCYECFNVIDTDINEFGCRFCHKTYCMKRILIDHFYIEHRDKLPNKKDILITLPKVTIVKSKPLISKKIISLQEKLGLVNKKNYF